MAKQKSVMDHLQEIAQRMCEGYCKYPDRYAGQPDDPEMKERETMRMIEQRCSNCPMYEFF